MDERDDDLSLDDVMTVYVECFEVEPDGFGFLTVTSQNIIIIKNHVQVFVYYLKIKMIRLKINYLLFLIVWTFKIK